MIDWQFAVSIWKPSAKLVGFLFVMTGFPYEERIVAINSSVPSYKMIPASNSNPDEFPKNTLFGSVFMVRIMVPVGNV